MQDRALNAALRRQHFCVGILDRTSFGVQPAPKCIPPQSPFGSERNITLHEYESGLKKTVRCLH